MPCPPNSPLVELGHRYRLRSRPARSTLHRVFNHEALGPPPGRRTVHLEEVRPEACVVLAQPPRTEPARPPRRLGAEPAQQLCFTPSRSGNCLHIGWKTT